jgi:hypothetical protein
VNFSRFGLFGFLVLTLAAGLNCAALYTAEQRFADLRDAGIGCATRRTPKI